MNREEIKGSWSKNLKWKFKLTENPPKNENLCTAVFCIIKNNKNEYLLIRNDRGWGFPGGHTEVGETVLEAVHREVLEETGLEIDQFTFFGYRTIISKEPILNTDASLRYPHPKTYNFYYIAFSNSKPSKENDEDILEISFFEKENILRSLKFEDSFMLQ